MTVPKFSPGEFLNKRNPVLTGVTGEYYVAAELSRRGYLASITLRNTKGVDILCSNSDASTSICIQVKTKTGMRRSWILTEKGEGFFADNFFYVFVNVSTNPEQHPEFTIVPSKIVANYARESHATWIQGKRADGGIRKNTSMRKFRDLEGTYLNRWDLLGLDREESQPKPS